jgi:hypothetical protein
MDTHLFAFLVILGVRLAMQTLTVQACAILVIRVINCIMMRALNVQLRIVPHAIVQQTLVMFAMMVITSPGILVRPVHLLIVQLVLLQAFVPAVIQVSMYLVLTVLLVLQLWPIVLLVLRVVVVPAVVPDTIPPVHPVIAALV